MEKSQEMLVYLLDFCLHIDGSVKVYKEIITIYSMASEDVTYIQSFPYRCQE